jgi:hypothetical protein
MTVTASASVTRSGGLLANTATITGRNLHRLVRAPTLIAFAAG